MSESLDRSTLHSAHPQWERSISEVAGKDAELANRCRVEERAEITTGSLRVQTETEDDDRERTQTVHSTLSATELIDFAETETGVKRDDAADESEREVAPCLSSLAPCSGSGCRVTAE